MPTSYKADPRFDPLRNARELGLSAIPESFLGGTDTAGSTDATATVSPDYAGRIPWIRLAVVIGVLWLVWRLGK
jgi:hypothetical protein